MLKKGLKTQERYKFPVNAQLARILKVIRPFKCEVTTAIRQEIEATLLLPQKELEDREWQGE